MSKRECCCAKETKLNVGDLAKVVNVGAMNNEIGDVLRVTWVDCDGDYRVTRIRDGRIGFVISYYVEPYTPAPGDELTVDGVKYTLERRKAEVGEDVIVVANNSDHKYRVGDIKKCEGAYRPNDDFISTGERVGYLRYSTDEYLVLSPLAKKEAPTAEPANDFRWIDNDEDDTTYLIAKYKSNISDHRTEVAFEAGGKFPQINGYSVYAIDIEKGDD